MSNNFGITGSVERDEDPCDPRENDNLGTMYCQHGKYNLGDKVTNLPVDITDGSYIILPLYLYDHSGITMATKPFSCGWDSGRVGIIYVKQGSEGIYDEDLKERLEAEVKEYNSFLTGDCWGYVVEDAEGEVLDSCWGYYLGDREYCEEEMKSLLATVIKQEGERIKEEVERIKARNLGYTRIDWCEDVMSSHTDLGLEEWRQHKEERDEDRVE